QARRKRLAPSEGKRERPRRYWTCLVPRRCVQHFPSVLLAALRSISAFMLQFSWHLRQCLELRHITTIDPIFQFPDPRTAKGDAIARADSVALSGRDQVERVALRPVANELP